MTDSMDHLLHLERVAMADVEHLLEKETTYKGSWKKSGGRSAWFMLKRKIDRLINMLARPEPPLGFDIENAREAELSLDELRYLIESHLSEDIFAAISDAPHGEDGTPLAEIRDLRRYLLLVESEMVARGAVEKPELKPVVVEQGFLKKSRHPVGDLGVVTEPGCGWDINLQHGGHCYCQRCHIPFWSANEIDRPVQCALQPKQAIIQTILQPAPACGWGSIKQPCEVCGAVWPASAEWPLQCPPACYYKHEFRQGTMPPPGTPEDGGHHAKQSDVELRREEIYREYCEPWVIGEKRITLLTARMTETCYRRHHPKYRVLEPWITAEARAQMAQDTDILAAGSEYRKLARLVLNTYIKASDTVYALRIEDSPEEYRSLWPSLRRELNHTEYTELLMWQQFLYSYDGGAKYIIKPEFVAWIPEAQR